MNFTVENLVYPPYLAMVKSLLTLTPELLENICSFLDANDLKNLGLSCKTLYGIISNDLIWQNFISRKYKIRADLYPDSTARAFYQHILHPHAPLIGLWLMEFKDFGGLLRVFIENGCLIGQEMFSHLSRTISLCADSVMQTNIHN